MQAAYIRARERASAMAPDEGMTALRISGWFHMSS
jgi:hypothetical protein